MGIFQNRGVEYHVVLDSGKHIPINCIASTDDRLVKSRYLQKVRSCIQNS